MGEPGLSARSRPPLASEAYAFWLDDVLRELAVPRVSIVGVSLGGWLALDYAIRRPGRVVRLALLCPGGIGRQKWAVLVAALLLMPFGRWGLRTTMWLAAGGALPVITPQAREFADYLMLVHRHFRPRRERLPIFDDDALGSLRMPVLAIVGGRDRMLDSFGTCRRLERAVPHATDPAASPRQPRLVWTVRSGPRLPPDGLTAGRRSCRYSLGIQGENNVGDITHRLVYPIDVADRSG